MRRRRVVLLSILLFSFVEAKAAISTTVPLPGGQSDFTTAVDSTGQHVVVGMTDTRDGRPSYLYSDEGGVTFIEGGPIGPASSSTMIIFGTPDVKYVGGPNFIIVTTAYVLGAAGSGTNSVGYVRSTDFGHRVLLRGPTPRSTDEVPTRRLALRA